MHDEHTRIDPGGPAARWRPTRLTVALAAAGGFLTGVLLVAALGGTPTTTQTEVSRITVTAPPKTLPGGTIVTMTAVPALVGEPLDSAKARLAEAQFEVDVEGGGLFGVLDDTNWEISGQEPAPGTQYQQGSTVHVSIVRR